MALNQQVNIEKGHRDAVLLGHLFMLIIGYTDVGDNFQILVWD